MLKNERQYKCAKAALKKWLGNRDIYLQRSINGEHPAWLLQEEKLAIEQEIKQLRADIEEYEAVTQGKKEPPPVAEYAEQLPSLLIRWRLHRNWTQRQLAERVGMHENMIQKYESENYGCVSLHTITKIAAVLQAEDLT
ncbi:MAG: helix-turn-helix transcriptional regulator [Candidatus Obscuribacter sp.]|nr:helix-turn-helix transcriptional regulator [Candidatus Obscuribacter sp.]